MEQQKEPAPEAAIDADSGVGLGAAIITGPIRDGNIVHVRSYTELNDALFEGTKRPSSGRYKSRCAYRGVSTANYRLMTSLMRQGGDYAELEYHLLRQFKKYAFEFVKERNSEWFWISAAQHYGLPTRLLDWSYSPQVALHFATANTDKFTEGPPGAVFMVDFQKAHERLPPKIRSHIERTNTWILTAEILETYLPTLQELDLAGEQHGDFFVFFEPPAFDVRLFNQFAYFSVASRVDLFMDEWLAREENRGLWTKVVFPASLKWEIRDKLDQNNVCERILFPGLDGVATWLKRYYLPTGEAALRPVYHARDQRRMKAAERAGAKALKSS